MRTGGSCPIGRFPAPATRGSRAWMARNLRRLVALVALAAAVAGGFEAVARGLDAGRDAAATATREAAQLTAARRPAPRAGGGVAFGAARVRRVDAAGLACLSLSRAGTVLR